jgi:hypothetical protein
MLSNKFGARERAIGITIAIFAIAAIAYSIGNAAGVKSGTAEGERSGWSRGTKVAFEKGYWQGVEDGCDAVYDATGWDFIYINVWHGGGSLPRSFCQDSGDHSNTPNVIVPFEVDASESN